MVKTFSAVEEKHENFFKDDFIATKGFYIKVKADDHTGKVTIKNNVPTLEAKLEHKHKVQDTKVKTETILKSNGEHELKGVWDLDDVLEKTELTHHSHFNSSTHEHKHIITLVNKAIKHTKNSFEFTYNNDKTWHIVHGIGHEICKRTSFAFDYTFCGKASTVVATNFGVLLKPTKWATSWLSYSTEGALNKDIDWKRFGTLGWKQRFETEGKTKLGFDYSYNLANRSSNILFGLRTRVSSGFDLSTKVASSGDIEASGKIEIADNWNLIVSSAMQGSGVTAKQQNVFGFGLEGKLK